METPWGRLDTLDLSDHALAADILGADKHQLLEGLVVECLFDQMLASLSQVCGHAVQALDVESVVVDTQRQNGRWVCFVWARSMGPGLGRYLQALEKCMDPWLVTLDAGEFMACRVQEGRRQSSPMPLQELMPELSGGRATPYVVKTSVRDRARQLRAFWGFISDWHKDRLGERVVLPRLLINCGIQPYFRSVWNLDRVLVVGNQVWLLEIKHKFPMDREALYFGINDGELRLLDRLAGADIRCLHTLLVKPWWSKEVGSMYLLNDLNARARTAVIATVLDRAATAALLASSSGRSGAHTSITGASALQFKSLAATDFRVLGLLSEPRGVTAQMSSLMAGQDVPAVEDHRLRGLRMHSHRF